MPPTCSARRSAARRRPNTYVGYRPYINVHDYDYTGLQHLRVYNNILLDTAGDMGPSYGLDIGTITDWASGNNCWWNNGNTVPGGNLVVGGNSITPQNESGSVTANPNLTLSGTRTTWQQWVNYYQPTSNSTAIRDAGNSNAGTCPQPGVVADIEGSGRPRGSGWDIGPYEWPGSYNTPVANFTGGPTLGSPPMGVDFQDLTSGAPTSWSWTFGDGGSSTAQNPSHVYNASGSYTVALTATNSAGNNTCSQPGFVTVKPLLAQFTCSPTWGAAPLAVSFTDLSTNSPTAWSWTFGDGGSSTAQNPSHTFTSAGNYTVSLTATNSLGSDTCQQTISACTVVSVYPDTWTSWNTSPPGNQTVVSGSLSNLQAEDASYMAVESSSTSGAPTTYSMIYTAPAATRRRRWPG